MTEKQFELIELEEFGLCIQDNDSGVLYYMNDRTSFATLCILLNEQEENLQLLIAEAKYINKQRHNLVNFLKETGHSLEDIKKIMNGDVE